MFTQLHFLRLRVFYFLVNIGVMILTKKAV